MSAKTMDRGCARWCVSGGARWLVLALGLSLAPSAAASPAAEGTPGASAANPSTKNGAANTAGERDRATTSPQERAAAQALFDEGRELMQNGHAAEACSRFEESDRLEPGLGTRFHLAACYEALGKLASAHALFLDVASEAKLRSQGERERLARQRAEAIEPRLSHLTIEVPFASASDVHIERDGEAIGSAQLGLAVPVDPGRHRVSATAPGRSPWSTEVDVAGDAAYTRVEVPPLVDSQQSFFAPTSRKLGLVALGVGVGTVALGSVFTVQALSKKSASNDAGCSDDTCSTQEGLELRRQALSAGTRATWAMSVGAVSLGAAAALFWLVPTGDEEGNGVQVTPAADLDGASVSVSGRF